MANIRSEASSAMSCPDMARTLYKDGFRALDSTKSGDATVTVNANALIDLMIAYENALDGDTGNIELALAVQAATADGAVSILEKARDRRWNRGDFDSDAAKAYAEDPYSLHLKKNGEQGVLAAGKRAYLAISQKNT